MAAPSTVVFLSGIQAEGAGPVWDISHGITVKGSARKWLMSLPFTFYYPKQVTWPSVTKLNREV